MTKFHDQNTSSSVAAKWHRFIKCWTYWSISMTFPWLYVLISKFHDFSMTLANFNLNSMTFREIPEIFKIPEIPWLFPDCGNPVFSPGEGVAQNILKKFKNFCLYFFFQWQEIQVTPRADMLDDDTDWDCDTVCVSCCLHYNSPCSLSKKLDDSQLNTHEHLFTNCLHGVNWGNIIVGPDIFWVKSHINEGIPPTNFICFSGFLSNSCERRQTLSDLSRMQVTIVRHLCRIICSLFPWIETCFLSLFFWVHESVNWVGKFLSPFAWIK